jgi:hypothetical protein
MKLTESRIKEIILEEMQSLQEQEEVQKEKEDDSAKNMAEFKKLLITLSQKAPSIKGASASEIQAISQMIVKMLKALPQGEISRYIQFADEQFSKKVK